MTVYAITDTKKGRTGIAPTYLQTTPTTLHVGTSAHPHFTPAPNPKLYYCLLLNTRRMKRRYFILATFMARIKFIIVYGKPK